MPTESQWQSEDEWIYGLVFEGIRKEEMNSKMRWWYYLQEVWKSRRKKVGGNKIKSSVLCIYKVFK